MLMSDVVYKLKWLTCLHSAATNVWDRQSWIMYFAELVTHIEMTNIRIKWTQHVNNNVCFFLTTHMQSLHVCCKHVKANKTFQNVSFSINCDDLIFACKNVNADTAHNIN